MHQKHVELKKPDLGIYHKNECSMVGAPCSIIEQLCEAVAKELGQKLKIGYLDSDHKQSTENSHPLYLKIQDKISYQSVDFQNTLTKFDIQFLAKNLSLLLVNGNHFEASLQVVLLHASKKESLERKLEKIQNPLAFIFADDNKEVYPFLKAKFPNWAQLPQFDIHQIELIAEFFRKKIEQKKPKINGLVLAGGKSQRMGEDKGGIIFHDKPQREYAAELLKPFCETVYISSRSEQIGDFRSNFEMIYDSFTGIGPFGAILSAFKFDPNAAWLIVACDLPLLTHDTINQLVLERDAEKLATAFKVDQSSFPEPLVAIWEPKAYPALLQFLSLGITCPRKVLINTDIKTIFPIDNLALANMNTPEDLSTLKARMEEKE